MKIFMSDLLSHFSQKSFYYGTRLVCNMFHKKLLSVRIDLAILHCQNYLKNEDLGDLWNNFQKVIVF